VLLTAPAFSDRENSRALADRVPAAAQEPLPAAQMPNPSAGFLKLLLTLTLGPKSKLPWRRSSRRVKRKRYYLVGLLVWVCLLSAVSALAQASVTTDQADYPPGSTVQISGTGFAPGERVQLQVLNLTAPNDLGAEHDPWTVTADTNGDLTASWFVTSDEANTTLQLTATGQTSGTVAQATFTDGPDTLLYLRSGTTTAIYGGSTANTLQTAAGSSASQLSSSSSSSPATFSYDFYSPPLSSSQAIASGSGIGGGGSTDIGLINNASSGSLTVVSITQTPYDYNPADGTSASIGGITQTVSPGTTINHGASAQYNFGPGGTTSTTNYTVAAGHILRISIAVNVSSATIPINCALYYNGASGTSLSLVSFPHGTGITWPFGSFANKLAFTTQPANTTAGSTMSSVVVQLQNSGGSSVSQAGVSITLAPSSGTLNGTTTATTDSTGKATFSNLSINPAATGYTLTAASSGLTSATSSSFNITAGSVSAANSTATASPTTGVLSDGTQTSTITVTALDAYNNPISGASVSLSVSGSGNTVSTPANTVANGQTTATIKSTVAETKTVTVTIAGTQINAQPTVAFGVAPSLSTQPAAQTVCSGTTATFTPAYSGTAPLSYAWRKRSNAGWGSGWTVSGTQYLQTSTQNENGGGTCNSFSSNLDINSASGLAWGMDGAGTAIRGFTALSAGQVFSVDMDNGGVDTGKTNGFRLQQTSGPVDLFKFYFRGGDANYTFWDGTGYHDTGIGWLKTGLRIQLILGSSSTYTLIVTACGSAAKEFSGTLPAGNIDRVLLENNNASTGDANRLFFNNLIAGTSDDNAGNYTSALTTGADKGDQIISSATGSSYTTPALSYPNDNGTNYAVLVYSPYGAVLSANAAATVIPASVGGTATPTASTLCSGGSTTITLTGSTGTIQWQASPNNTTFTNIPSATGTTYNTPALTQTTYYRAVLTSGVCSSANSSVATVTVNPASVGGTATAGASSFCASGSTTITLSGSTGSIQWQASPDNSTFTNIPSATSSTYATPTLTATTYYRAVLTSGVCSSANSSTATVTIYPTSAGGTATPTASTLCSGGGTTITLAGNTGTIQWQASPDNTTFTNIPSATSATYNTPALTATTYYRAIVTSGICSSSTSAVASVTVNVAPVITGNPASATNLYGTTASFTVTNSGTTPAYQWRRHNWIPANTWTLNAGGGGFFVGSSSNNGTPPSGNIDTSGNSWGLYNNNAASVTEAIRSFGSALVVGKTFQLDMDNGFITAGKSVGFSLRNASGNIVWEFFYTGSSVTDSYQINDNSGAHYTPASIPFTADGLRIVFTLASSTTYSVTVQTRPVAGGGTSYGPFTGTLLNPTGGSVPAQVRLFDANGTGAGASSYDLFFNSIIVSGGIYSSDNAANYTTGIWVNGSDLSVVNLANGAQADGSTNSGAASTNLQITTVALADARYYDLVVSNACGTATSAAAGLTVNPAVVTVASGLTANNRTYDGTTVATLSSNSVSLSGVIAGDAASVFLSTNGYTATFASASKANGLAVTVSGLTLTGSAAGNYSLTQPALSANITGAPLTITATNQSKTYGTALALGTTAFSVGSGLATGESVTAVSLVASGGTNATDAAGSYTITPSAATGTGGFLASNYAITYATGTLTVNQAGTSVTVASSANPTHSYASVFFTATLPSAATGSVIFKTNGAALSTNAVSGGTATSLTTTSLPRGTNTITAEYAGDGNYLGSTNNLPGGQVMTNSPPAAGTATYVRGPGTNLRVTKSTLLATYTSDPDGDTVVFQSVGTSTNGAAVTTDTKYIYYVPTNNSSDGFTYTVNDGHGGVTTGQIVVSVAKQGGVAQNVSYNASGVTIIFAGIPGYTYDVQRDTNVTFTTATVLRTTNAPSGGVFIFTDTSPPQPSGYYRLIQH